jgi:peptidoglycan/LPS O-acetylase OafA/YrhL
MTLFLSVDQRSTVEARPVLNFFIRRFFRIAPLFYLALVVYTVAYGTGPNYWAPKGIQWWQYPLTMVFLNSWHPESINAIIPIGWSVAVETMFYLLIPFLYKLLKDTNATLIFIVISLIVQKILVVALGPILASISPSYIVERYFYFWLFAQLPVFAMGILAYQIVGNSKNKRDPKLGTALLITALFLFVTFLNINTYLNLIPVHVFYGFGFLILTLSLYFHPNKLFVNPVTRWIGKISYSLYLVHFIVEKYIYVLFPVALPFGKTAQFVIYFLVTILISSIVSSVTYHLIEVQGMKLGKNLILKLENRAYKEAIEETD